MGLVNRTISRYKIQKIHILNGLVLLLITLLCLPVQSRETGIESLRDTGKAFAFVAKKASPAVVNIQVEKIATNQPTQIPSPFERGMPNEFFRHFFGPGFPGKQPGDQSHKFRQIPQQPKNMMGQGSGFIISEDGYILTNSHVVGAADKVTVKLEDGREFIASKVGVDPQSDVAVIKIEASDLPTISLGDSDSLDVGEWVIAIGNPFGLSHTLTAGIVSAKGRSNVGLADYENFIQTDAAINPGNSGGPLVDLNGNVIGMNTAIFSRSGGYMGIGFAIPVNMVKAIKDQLILAGEVTRGYLGIVIQDLTPKLADSFGLGDQKGIIVAQVAKNSPAEKSGFRQGDVIEELDGQVVSNVGSFRNKIAMKKPGSKHDIKIIRKGKEQQNLSVVIGKLPVDIVAESGTTESLNNLGFSVQNLTPSRAQELNLNPDLTDLKGVVVTQVVPSSPADRENIQVGSIIEQVNHQQVTSTGEFKSALKKSEKDKSVLLLVKTGQYANFVVLKTG